jgi:hypothetical protein
MHGLFVPDPNDQPDGWCWPCSRRRPVASSTDLERASRWSEVSNGPIQTTRREISRERNQDVYRLVSISVQEGHQGTSSRGGEKIFNQPLLLQRANEGSEKTCL